jgi:hypothetical protein
MSDAIDGSGCVFICSTGFASSSETRGGPRVSYWEANPKKCYQIFGRRHVHLPKGFDFSRVPGVFEPESKSEANIGICLKKIAQQFRPKKLQLICTYLRGCSFTFHISACALQGPSFDALFMACGLYRDACTLKDSRPENSIPKGASTWTVRPVVFYSEHPLAPTETVKKIACPAPTV